MNVDHLYFQKQEEIELAIIYKNYTKLDLLQLKYILLKLHSIISEEQEKISVLNGGIIVDLHDLRKDIFKIAYPYIKTRPNVALSIGIIYQDQEATFTFGGSNFMLEEKPYIYEVGSISKVLTTSILGEMIQEGKVHVEDSLGKYFSSIPDNHPVTLKRLANHTSGLPGIGVLKNIYNVFDAQTPRDPFCQYSLDETIHYFKTHTDEPKVKFRYSNVGMGLLGYILANILHTDYETAIKQRLTDPLNMPNTFISIPSDQADAVLQGYTILGHKKPPLQMNEFMAAGAARSTVHDLLTFMKVHLRDENLGYTLTHQATETFSENIGIGLGWQLADNIIWHNGSTKAFSSYLGFDKTQQTGVVVLSNYRSPILAANPSQIGKDILQLLQNK
ncbi:serine hydrolase [Lysinibacillus sp. FJAT-14745]|uniref:serine hydrolase domain-containing protein n=1 Tax=Lysinibacillus sp. FJAT-14745 TaxID=1704289 RepID=UPI0006AB99D9|nr:serine hydrolase domain-containing protein [Lysinibacillus sp. FJAT-14745]